MVVSQDYELCLATEHTKRRGSPRSHELVDTDAEGAILFTFPNFIFGNRSTVAVLNSTFDNHTLQLAILA